MSEWHPASWQAFTARQQPNYPDQDALAATLGQLAEMPPLVTSWEIESLKQRLAAAQRGEAFILQGGDCAENFADCRAPVITNQMKILLQMSLVLLHGLNRPVVRLGRIAGQYAKPRSADMETRDGVSLPSYRGDIVNSPEFTAAARIPDPQRMVQGHGLAAMTLNFIRALSDCGFADLHHPENWDLDFVRHSPMADEYRKVVDELHSALRFVGTLGGTSGDHLNRVSFFTSHEGLLLPYEQAMTRRPARRSHWYDLSTHLPWIGFRTAELDGAHVEFFRGIANPIGVKVGPGMSHDWVNALVERLNPENEPGKLVLIVRFGASKVADGLPPLIEAVRATGREVVWMVDPMHGNTESTDNGYKTRNYDNILSELEQSLTIHEEMGGHLGGVHFELSGDNVTECIGGARGLEAADLVRAYKSQVDPRLNYEQALEMAMAIVRHQQRTR